MIAAESNRIPIHTRMPSIVPLVTRKRFARLGAVLTAPVFCLGLSLMGLVPLLIR